MSVEYKDQVTAKNQERIDELLEILPHFYSLYVIAELRKKSRQTIRTYLERNYFLCRWLAINHPDFCEREIKTFTLSDFENLSIDDVHLFLNYLFLHQGDDHGRQNKNSTVESYLSSINAVFKHFLIEGKIKNNPFGAISRQPKARPDPLYLEGDDNVSFYENVLNGTGLTDRQLLLRDTEHAAYRDYLICRMLGTTGIRVSELVGLDLDDVNTQHMMLTVIRKGRSGKTEASKIYYSDALQEEILYYLKNERPLFRPAPDEQAFFLVSHGKHKGERLEVRSVENLVKKYAMAQHIPDADRFTPHKFRHTYAMNVLRKSGNLSLTQQLLGHRRPETTTIYARMLEKDLRDARNLGEN